MKVAAPLPDSLSTKALYPHASCGESEPVNGKKIRQIGKIKNELASLP